MSADPTSIERIRNATFASARRGYKKQDVDQFLARLTDWLEGNSGQEANAATKQALQDVGKRTSGILVAAQDSAEKILEAAQKERRQADEYATDVREKAERQAESTRTGSEADAQRTRSEAERDAEETKSKARAAVRKIEEEGETAKAEIRAEIDDLDQRRVDILRRVDELATQLSGTAKEHRDPADASGADSPVEGEQAAEIKAPKGPEPKRIKPKGKGKPAEAKKIKAKQPA